jgi:hypothetical protein
MRNALERAWAADMETLVFTGDLPVAGSRYRDRRSGMSICRTRRGLKKSGSRFARLASIPARSMASGDACRCCARGAARFGVNDLNTELYQNSTEKISEPHGGRKYCS